MRAGLVLLRNQGQTAISAVHCRGAKRPLRNGVSPGVSQQLTLVLLLAFAAATCLADVEVVGGKCVLVDGKAFFPIGVYSAGADSFEKLAEAGFNTVHTYGWEGVSSYGDGDAWLDAAQEHGLKALVGLYRPRVKGMELEGCVPRIEHVRDHPALLAWHTMDEPSWDKEGDMGKDYMPAAYELVKQHDSDHPVTAVTCHFGDMDLFEATVDVMQADYYPVPPIPAEWYSGTGFRGVKMFVDKWREASGGEKPFWYVGQIFDFSVSKEKSYDVPDEWKRLPTGEELRAMTYTAVAAGARGIIYWSYSRLMGDDWIRDPADRERFWGDLVEVVGELNELMPLLTADSEETFAGANGVASMVKNDGTDTYIIAVNHERHAATAIITVPGVESGTANGVFNAAAEGVVEGQVAVMFEPLEVKVLKVEGVTTD